MGCKNGQKKLDKNEKMASFWKISKIFFDECPNG